MTEASRPARRLRWIGRTAWLLVLALGATVHASDLAAPRQDTGEWSATTDAAADDASGQDPGGSPLATPWTPRIGVITMGPGSEYWSRFGHNAIIVTQPDGRALSYNYGFFDFAQPNFLTRFVRGKMLYMLAVSDLERELWQYGQEGRSVRMQWLRLSPAESRQLADFLAWNALPANADYRYDYFLANCSTRVRDALDDVLGGRLRETGRTRSRGLSYRTEALRLGAEVPWMMLGMHLLLGPDADAPLSRWEEAFLPEHLASLMALTRRADGTPLVEETIDLLPQKVAGSAAVTPRFWGRTLLTASVSGLVLVLLHRSTRRGLSRFASWLAAGWWFLAGLVGLGMLGLWFGTDHSMAAANRNLLLFPPIAFGLLPWLALRRGKSLARATWWLCVAGAVIATALLFLSVRDQDNLEWLMLTLPILVATRFLLDDDASAPG